MFTASAQSRKKPADHATKIIKKMTLNGSQLLNQTKEGEIGHQRACQGNKKDGRVKLF